MGDSGGTRRRSAIPMTVRALLVAGFVIAVGATALVVFANDVRMLRLAAVLALWAALIAAFTVARFRRDAKVAVMRRDEAQLTYQLELHREVAARREYEADLTRQAASAQSDQLAELREQLERLTGVLSSLVDGELTVSRLTLSAESARFRPGQTLTGAATAVTDGRPDGRPPAQLDRAVAIDADPEPAAAQAVAPPAPPAPPTPAATVAPAGPRPDAPAAAWARRHADWARTIRVEQVVAGPPRTPATGAEAADDHPTEPIAAVPASTEVPGDHESGVSVSDLLAAYGLSGRPRRRRRD